MVSTKRPSKAYVIGVYFKRLIRWRRDSSPFLSGDAFSKIADVHIGGSKWRNRNPTSDQISRARVIYCRSDLLQDFLNSFTNPINAKVIISGNSDHEFHTPIENIPDSISALFLQNSFISDNRRIFTLPIGIENFRFGVNGHPRLMRANLNVATKSRNVLFGPFGNTHPIRNEIIRRFSSVPGPWQILEGRWKPKRYAKVARTTMWVAVVRGNGIDTHRLWETLYRGSIPILMDDAWSRSLKYLNFPIATVQSWDIESIKNIVRDDLGDLRFDPKQIEALWMPYWERRIKEIAFAKNVLP